MEIGAVDKLQQRKYYDLLVLPFWKEKKGALAAFKQNISQFSSFFVSPIKMKDFVGKEGETLLFYPTGDKTKRLLLLGLGEKKKVDSERLRRSIAQLIDFCHSKKIERLSILLPCIADLSAEAVATALLEGLFLANYSFDKLKKDSIKKDPTTLLKAVEFIGLPKKRLKDMRALKSIFDGVYLTRDLVNSNADEITPQFLSKEAKSIAKKYRGVTCRVFDKKRIVREKMGLLLAVNRGSSLDPAFIILKYVGNPKSKDHTVIVGKGITYDTGGLNLKPTGFMETMKEDMAGAATALGIIKVAGSLGLKNNITAVIPTTENSIGSKSYKPGDVYTSYAGKTVEISNTDAEGRLILADALAWSVKNLKPTRIIDFATLTGGCIVALGEEASGLMTNDDNLASLLEEAGRKTFERVWRLPLFEEYKEQLKSDIADIVNSGEKSASAIAAALFLQEFVGKTPWAHIDIAGTAFLSKKRRYLPKYATGSGIRLIINFLENV